MTSEGGPGEDVPVEVVARPTRTATWTLLRDGETVATAYALCRPDRRWFVSVDGWRLDDHPALVHAMIDDLRHDLHTRIDGADADALELWSRFGFALAATELEFVFSPDPARTGLTGAALPPGLTLLGADEVDEALLRKFDDELRGDVPGSEGWINDPVEFHDSTFDERRFDPATYLVAVDDQRERFAGLVRIWSIGDRSRLGLVAVARPYRRRGLARGLLAAALQVLTDRGVTVVLAEADATNVAGLALLDQIGATRTGSSLVLRRRAEQSG